jgi:hypothetical protein
MRDTCVESAWEVRRRLKIKHMASMVLIRVFVTHVVVRIWFFEPLMEY